MKYHGLCDDMQTENSYCSPDFPLSDTVELITLSEELYTSLHLALQPRQIPASSSLTCSKPFSSKFSHTFFISARMGGRTCGIESEGTETPP